MNETCIGWTWKKDRSHFMDIDGIVIQVFLYKGPGDQEWIDIAWQIFHSCQGCS